MFSTTLTPTPGTGAPTGPARVAGRWVFYNNTLFDGITAEADAADDGAIAPDKSALLPGETASLANYTSFAGGINGIMIDVACPTDTGEIGTGNFRFRVGGAGDPAAWDAAPAPQSVTVRPGEGVKGADRVTILWDDGAIQNQWLQVTVVAGPSFGLLRDDVFYFGNAVAEAGNSTTDALVNAADVAAVQDHPHGLLNGATIADLHDFNRDGHVNATDSILARDNATSPLTALRLIAPPVVTAGEGSPVVYANPSPIVRKISSDVKPDVPDRNAPAARREPIERRAFGGRAPLRMDAVNRETLAEPDAPWLDLLAAIHMKLGQLSIP